MSYLRLLLDFQYNMGIYIRVSNVMYFINYTYEYFQIMELFRLIRLIIYYQTK